MIEVGLAELNDTHLNTRKWLRSRVPYESALILYTRAGDSIYSLMYLLPYWSEQESGSAGGLHEQQFYFAFLRTCEEFLQSPFWPESASLLLQITTRNLYNNIQSVSTGKPLVVCEAVKALRPWQWIQPGCGLILLSWIGLHNYRYWSSSSGRHPVRLFYYHSPW